MEEIIVSKTCSFTAVSSEVFDLFDHFKLRTVMARRLILYFIQKHNYFHVHLLCSYWG